MFDAEMRWTVLGHRLLDLTGLVRLPPARWRNHARRIQCETSIVAIDVHHVVGFANPDPVPPWHLRGLSRARQASVPGENLIKTRHRDRNPSSYWPLARFFQQAGLLSEPALHLCGPDGPTEVRGTIIGSMVSRDFTTRRIAARTHLLNALAAVSQQHATAAHLLGTLGQQTADAMRGKRIHEL